MERELLLEELEPYVRSALTVPLPPLIGQSMHKSYDNRMFYLLDGSASVVLNGESTIGKAMYFYAPALSQGVWINANRTYYKTIGCHRFYL